MNVTRASRIGGKDADLILRRLAGLPLTEEVRNRQIWWNVGGLSREQANGYAGLLWARRVPHNAVEIKEAAA